MIVDDEKDVATIITRMLEAGGYKVRAFSNPLKAWEHFIMNPDYDVVISDVRMLRMSGFELARMIRDIKPDVKIMLMTAYQIDSLDLESTLPIIKYKDILNKPFRLKEICDGIKKQLQIAS